MDRNIHDRSKREEEGLRKAETPGLDVEGTINMALTPLHAFQAYIIEI